MCRYLAGVQQLFGFLIQASSNLHWLFWACPDWVFPRDLGVLELGSTTTGALASPRTNVGCNHWREEPELHRAEQGQDTRPRKKNPLRMGIGAW